MACTLWCVSRLAVDGPRPGSSGRCGVGGHCGPLRVDRAVCAIYTCVFMSGGLATTCKQPQRHAGCYAARVGPCPRRRVLAARRVTGALLACHPQHRDGPNIARASAVHVMLWG